MLLSRSLVIVNIIAIIWSKIVRYIEGEHKVGQCGCSIFQRRQKMAESMPLPKLTVLEHKITIRFRGYSRELQENSKD
ncbi:hypothetical protein AVDCRST_MAG94-6770 [uncultured Leptolyngbya sp.]|uniref:Uncharacterized protein n=1 Tax=uncultured Leptolyngbya sp. TaxID=332963 RepID=A0A6J4PJ22_9CYAN|nr:hypothetical protein AVDCRST_MAG94-6770 [uncultured Leptolyngbya sp.]